MKLHIEWARPIQLKDGSKQRLIYHVDTKRITTASGVYVFGRRWGSGFEALYVGKASNLRSRVKSHLNNLRLMQHLKHAKTGKRIVLTGRLVTKPGQRLPKCLSIAERALIRSFLAKGDDLVNLQGTRLRRHEVASSGKHPKRFIPSPVHVDRG